MNPAEAEGEVDRIMKIVDKNESGEIDYSGNVNLHPHSHPPSNRNNNKRVGYGYYRQKKFIILITIRINF